jgi:hypothetical protein
LKGIYLNRKRNKVQFKKFIIKSENNENVT